MPIKPAKMIRLLIKNGFKEVPKKVVIENLSILMEE